MKTLTLAVVLLVSSVAAADPQATVTNVKIGTCAKKCPTGLRYLAEVTLSTWQTLLFDKPIHCTGQKAGSTTFTFAHDINQADAFVVDDEKTRAKWPACVKQIAEQVPAKWNTWFLMLRDIDSSIDFPVTYKVTVAWK